MKLFPAVALLGGLSIIVASWWFPQASTESLHATGTFIVLGSLAAWCFVRWDENREE